MKQKKSVEDYLKTIYILKIDAADLTPVVLGDPDSVTVGEDVYAIGNPFGELTFTLTGGLISAKDRSVTSSDGMIINMIQTDTAINSGNSGGPLFDQYGQAVGIVSAKMSGSNSSSSSVEGLGFAIPINDVRDMVTSIIQNGYVTGKPNLGILTGNVNSFAPMQTGRLRAARYWLCWTAPVPHRAVCRQGTSSPRWMTRRLHLAASLAMQS